MGGSLGDGGSLSSVQGMQECVHKERKRDETSRRVWQGMVVVNGQLRTRHCVAGSSGIVIQLGREAHTLAHTRRHTHARPRPFRARARAREIGQKVGSDSSGCDGRLHEGGVALLVSRWRAVLANRTTEEQDVRLGAVAAVVHPADRLLDA